MQPSQQRGQRKKAAIVDAAAAIAREQGFGAVRHRAVAQRARVPLGSTTYYFSSLDDLLGAVATALYDEWLGRGAGVVENVGTGSLTGADAAALLVKAILPSTDHGEILAYYEQLLGAARHQAVAEAWRNARPRIEHLVSTVLSLADLGDRNASLALAVVDGAVVSALSEGRQDVPEFVTRLVREHLLL